MPKDGPTISGGYRFGGNAAFRSYLPPRAISHNGDLESGRALEDFCDYPKRARSIGKPVPKSIGISEQRAATLQKIEDLKVRDCTERAVVLKEENGIRLKWVSNGRQKWLVKEDLVHGTAFRSFCYGSKKRALQAYGYNQVIWKRIPT